MSEKTSISAVLYSKLSRLGCDVSGNATDDQIRINLKSKIQEIDICINNSPKKSKQRKAFGAEKHELLDVMYKLKKTLTPKKELAFHIVDILKEDLTELEYKRLSSRARQRAANE